MYGVFCNVLRGVCASGCCFCVLFVVVYVCECVVMCVMLWFVVVCCGLLWCCVASS